MASRFWVGGSGTWDASTTTNWSASTGGSGGASAPTSADTVTFDASSGSGTCTLSGLPACSTLSASATSITTFTGTGTLTVAGNFTLKSGLTISGWTGLVTFTGTTPTLTTAGNTFAFPLTITGASSQSAALSLADDLTISGNLTINGANGTTGRIIVQSNTAGATRTITANGTLTVTNADFMDITGAGSASWNLAAITGLSGDCGGNTGITFTTAAAQTATGTAAFTWSTHGWTTRVPLPQDNVTVNNAFSGSPTVTADMPRLGKSITFGCTGTPTLNITVASSIFGSLDLTGVGTFTASLNGLTFGGRSATFTLKSVGLNIDKPVTINAFSGTLQLADNLSVGTATSRAFTLNGGTFDLSSFNLTHFGTFSSSNSNTRSVTGSGTWSITSTATATIWFVATATNFTFSLSNSVVVSGNAAGGVTRTISIGNVEAAAANFNITAGADIISNVTSVGGMDFVTGSSFTGSWANTTKTIYGNIKINASMTVTAGTNVSTLGGTSGTKTITSNGINLDFPITINAAGATWQLLDNTSVGTGTARTISFTTGTFDLNGKTLTHFGTVTSTGSSTRVLGFGTNGIWDLTNTAIATVWNAVATNFSTTGTGTMKISGSTTNVRTFAGGGITYSNFWYTNATASGEVDITGSNTFADFKCTDTNGQTIKFTAATTTTVSTFTVSGAANNLITIGSITAASHTLSKSSGTVSVSYCTISRSTATGGASWQAYVKDNYNVNGGNNVGWIFGLVYPTNFNPLNGGVNIRPKAFAPGRTR